MRRYRLAAVVGIIVLIGAAAPALALRGVLLALAVLLIAAGALWLAAGTWVGRTILAAGIWRVIFLCRGVPVRREDP